MANFFKPVKSQTDRYFDLEITDLDGKCRGVGHNAGRTWFVSGTMPGDSIRAEKKEISKGVGTASVQKFHARSSDRITENLCEFSDRCGGCSCQFIPVEKQIDAKCRGLRQVFRKNVGIELQSPDRIVTGAEFGYRRVCRLSTYYNRSNRIIEIGFRMANSNRIVEIADCRVLLPELSAVIAPLRTVVNCLESRAFIGHIELLRADNGIFVLIRHTGKFPDADREILKKWSAEAGVTVYVQNESNSLICVSDKELKPCYEVRGVRYDFLPDAFIQINGAVNNEMIDTVLEYMAPKNNESILDLFSGMGNFTLQLAGKAGSVTGVEVVDTMVKTGNSNAVLNGIDNVSFVRCDLSREFQKEDFARKSYDGILLDPGRDGAACASSFIAKVKPKRVVYVSCNPITATRDFKILIDAGYNFKRWSIFNMFTHTEHVETVVLLSRDKA